MGLCRVFATVPIQCRRRTSLNCIRGFSTTAVSRVDEDSNAHSRIDNFIWQLKLTCCLTGVAASIYSAYVFISSGYDIERSRRKVTGHYYSIKYGPSLPKRVEALINSRFNACLNSEVLDYVARYFIKFDLLKENGFTRRDAILFLEGLGIEEKHPLVEQFIAGGVGESRDHRIVSGCSLQEFAELLESLVLENRINGGNEIEGNIKTELEKIVGDDVASCGAPRKFRLNNPILWHHTSQLTKELRKYVEADVQAAKTLDLENEIRRLNRAIDQLDRISKSRGLSDAERKRKVSIEDELEMLRAELAKEHNVANKLRLM
ncbi:uncharacterized protein BBOV_IV001750 [Babesia bovis T2Bo]|uniref:uncharacterized protein n=1 Tax=Babesia bovis T2Bo TaxID=484906 RepID=UPI001E154F43|nr:uncharacterized protein BBOV_IV001750 [Babesia bovis T2Bo]EDO05772.2 hypothetical protein BBOV_IV001750 [Babesia bovis T2Bo]